MLIKLVYKSNEAGLNQAVEDLGDVKIIDIKPFGTYSDKTSALILYEKKVQAVKKEEAKKEVKKGKK